MIDLFTATPARDGSRMNVIVYTSGGFDRYTLWRIAFGKTVIVRGAQNEALGKYGDVFAGDYEAPQNTTVQYMVEVTRASDGATLTATTTAGGVLDFGADYLFDLSRPGATFPVHVERVPEWKRQVPGELVWVDGRDDPVAVSRTVRLPSAPLDLIAVDELQRRAVASALDNGNIIALSPRFPIDGVWYLAVVGDITETPLSPQDRSDFGRRLSLPVQQIAPPPAEFTPAKGRTCAEVVALGWTNAHVVAQNMTCLDVMFK